MPGLPNTGIALGAGIAFGMKGSKKFSALNRNFVQSRLQQFYSVRSGPMNLAIQGKVGTQSKFPIERGRGEQSYMQESPSPEL